MVTLLLCDSAFATTIVAIIDRDNHAITVASDSLQRRGTKSERRCKIIEIPNCVVAMAGMYDKPYPPFHLETLIRDACSQPGDLRYKANVFATSASSPVGTLIQYLHDSEPTYYAEEVNSAKGDFIDVLFLGIQDGYLSIIAWGFRVENGVVRAISDEITDHGPKDAIMFAGGANDHIIAYAKDHKNWEHMGYVPAARRFVQIEIQAHPKIVGPPISVFQIDWLGRGIWIDRGACGDGGKPPHKDKKHQH